jgi:hypothetical protein
MIEIKAKRIGMRIESHRLRGSFKQVVAAGVFKAVFF